MSKALSTDSSVGLVRAFGTPATCVAKVTKFNAGQASMQAFFGQNRKTQFPIFKTQFRFFGQKSQIFLKNSAKTYEP